MRDQTRQLLTRLDQAPMGQPPLAELLAGGRAAKRRHRGVAVLASGLVAVIVVFAGLWSFGGNAPDHASDRGAVISAPAGTILVGIGRAVVAVPDTWTLRTSSCPGDATDIYYYPHPTDGICPTPLVDPRGSTVAITTYAAADDQPLRRAEPVGGYAVVDSGDGCTLSLPGHCSETFGIPSLDAYFRLDSTVLDADKIIRAIRSSLTVLPEGQLALPSLVGETRHQASEQLSNLDLTAKVAAPLCTPGGDCTLVTSTAPTGGAIVPTGSSVTLNLGELPVSVPPDRNPQLEGTWKVHALVGHDGQSLLSPAQRDTLTLTFHHGTIGGHTACNDIFGTYQQNGSTVQLHPAETQVACNEPPLIQRLLDVRHLSTTRGHLYLHAENWMTVIDLQRG